MSVPVQEGFPLIIASHQEGCQTEESVAQVVEVPTPTRHHDDRDPSRSRLTTEVATISADSRGDAPASPRPNRVSLFITTVSGSCAGAGRTLRVHQASCVITGFSSRLSCALNSVLRRVAAPSWSRTCNFRKCVGDGYQWSLDSSRMGAWRSTRGEGSIKTHPTVRRHAFIVYLRDSPSSPCGQFVVTYTPLRCVSELSAGTPISGPGGPATDGTQEAHLVPLRAATTGTGTENLVESALATASTTMQYHDLSVHSVRTVVPQRTKYCCSTHLDVTL